MRDFWLCVALLCFVYGAFCRDKNLGKLDIDVERGRVLDLFYHGYTNYMENAFPFDELAPLSCSGRNTIGNYSLTLVDSLDMLAMIGDLEEFQKQVRFIQSEDFSFNINVNVSTFETNIRILGGLLSSHLLAEDLLEGYPWDRKPLLTKAIEIGDILTKAFNTPTGIPYGTVNLENGGSVPPEESKVTSLATAGTFIIEFGVLSRLTNNPLYENLAKDALYAVWNHRSEMNLLGNHIDITTGRWISMETSIGGNSDSFYEYLLKGSILFGDSMLREIFDKSYSGIMRHVLHSPWYPQVNMQSGKMTAATFESLQAFWPGLQVLVGDIEEASFTMHAFQSIWHRFGFVPEVYDLSRDALIKGREQYPLRPEMAESLYYLYSATRDPIWLEYGQEIINSLEKYAKVPCGVAAVENVQTKELRDHMDSFFLSETCKYLYMLFTPMHPIAVSQKYIFNTEGHPFPIRYDWIHDSSSNSFSSGQCASPSLEFKLSHRNFQPRQHHAQRLEDQKALSFLGESDGLDSVGNESNPEEVPKEENLPLNQPVDASVLLIEVLEPQEFIDTKEAVFLALFGPQEMKKELVGQGVRTNPADACSRLKGDIRGKIALVNRGTCDFVAKVRRCQEAGAIGVVIINNNPSEDGHQISMTGEGPDIVIPSVFVSHEFGKVVDTSAALGTLILRIGKGDMNWDQLLQDAVVIDLSNFEDGNPELIREQIESIIQSLNIDESESLSRQLSDFVSSLDLKAIGDDEDDIEHFNFKFDQNTAKIVGKQMHNCVDGEC